MISEGSCDSEDWSNDAENTALITGINYITFTFSHLADAFIQSDLQMRTIEAIRINKRAMIHKCYNKS